MVTSIRISALFLLALLVPGFWAAGWVYPQYNTGGGLGRIGPGFTSLGVVCLSAPLALIVGARVSAAAIRQRQRGWLVAALAAVAAAVVPHRPTAW
jgi:ABC-type Fe3+ transport system permease subunit